MALLDDFPFSWHRPEAVQLHRTLLQLFPSPEQAKFIARQVQIVIYAVNANQSIDLVWFGLIDQAVSQGLLRDLTQKIADTVSPKSPSRPFLVDLLDDVPPVLAAEPDRQGGDAFINGNAEITEPEALLFHEDLSLQIGRIPALIRTLQTLLSRAAAVCKLEVDFGGPQFAGTGFRIGPCLILTNWHVLHHPQTGAIARSVSAHFGYEDDAAGHLQAGQMFPCDCGTIFGERAADWSVIEVPAGLDAAIATVDLTKHAVPLVDGAAFIIQHPQGVSKRIAFLRNMITDVTDQTVHYLTDTQQGSSGAPVFNGTGDLIALHRAGGLPQSVLGQQPIIKNEGVRIPLILDALRAAGKLP